MRSTMVPGTVACAPPPPRADEAFATMLYNEYGAALLRVVLRMTKGDRLWAEDVSQETVLRAWRAGKRLSYGECGSLMPWLVTVARRIVIDDVRARQARARALAEAPGDPPFICDRTDQTLERIVVRAALAKLTQIHREALIEVYLRGRTVLQFAQAYRLPLGTAKSRVYYALRALREELREQGVE
jgi:RNA polymerase sigma-70 factor, ECF subfamily